MIQQSLAHKFVSKKQCILQVFNVQGVKVHCRQTAFTKRLSPHWLSNGTDNEKQCGSYKTTAV